jgi:sensor histidine kinase YesM
MVGIIFCMLVFTYYLINLNRLTVVQEGKLDLRTWTGEEAISLNGDWEFYWDQLLAPEEALMGGGALTGYYPVPMSWTRYQDLSLPPLGDATYQIEIQLPSDMESLALLLPKIYTEYQIWSNGSLLAANGFSDSVQPRYMSQKLVRINDLNGSLDLVLQIKNDRHVLAGPGQGIQIGSFESIYRERTIGLAVDLAIVSVCLSFSLYHALLFLFRRHTRTYAYFALLCLAVSFRSLINNQNFLLFIWPEISFEAGSRMMTATIPLIILTVLIYLRSVNRQDFPTWLFSLLFVINLAYVLAVFTLPTIRYLSIFNYYLISTFAVCVLMVYFSVLSMLRDADGSLIFTIGAIMLVFGALFDTLYYYQLINTGIFLSLGLVGFAGTQTLLLALYFSKVEQDRQTLKKKLLVTDLSLLRAQIRPHFIYNALGTISSAISRNPAEAKALLLDFSDFLRGCFSTEREDGLTSLSSELNTVRAYLSLEKARFRDRLNVIYDLAEDESRFVPILSIQPIVENAVRHGLMPKIDGGTVKIRTWHDGGQTHIVVEDDGIGILKDDILTGPQSLNDTGNGIGLQNINRRLKILYDTQLIIDSRPWHGTRVEIVLPASHREEDIL